MYILDCTLPSPITGGSNKEGGWQPRQNTSFSYLIKILNLHGDLLYWGYGALNSISTSCRKEGKHGSQSLCRFNPKTICHFKEIWKYKVLLIRPIHQIPGNMLQRKITVLSRYNELQNESLLLNTSSKSRDGRVLVDHDLHSCQFNLNIL